MCASGFSFLYCRAQVLSRGVTVFPENERGKRKICSRKFPVTKREGQAKKRGILIKKEVEKGKEQTCCRTGTDLGK